MVTLHRLAVRGFIGAFILTAPVCLGEQAEDIGRIRGENGQLSLVIAVPLTNEYVSR
jgi:hypothetical protein